MKHPLVKFFAGICVFLLFLGFGYYYGEGAARIFQEFFSKPQPCQKPITYSIANIDPRFGLTKDELLADMQQAEKMWESPIGKQLFEYSPDGDLKISLVYDYRQKATDELKKMGIVINDDRSTYDELKARYDSLLASYDKGRAQLESLTAVYNKDKIAFENDINYWNGRGGAPKAEYKALEKRRTDLERQAAVINQAASSLNELVDIINSTEAVLNKLIVELNLQVDKYNATGSLTGKEFNEGEYTSNAGGTAINIFQFSNKDQLMRVLVHELGHALGLGHLDNHKAIMYYLNEGVNEELTADDLEALKNVCGIK